MKLLHTSDWHVGKTIRGASRAVEHTAVLAEIAQIAAREEVDLVIVAGDLFDSAAPSAEAENIVYRALLGLADTGAEVAVIAGNHDNPRRLRAVAPLLRLGQIHVVAEPARPDDGGVIGLRTRDGTDVRLAMLPFVSKRGIVRAKHLMTSQAFENAQYYSDRLRLLIERLCEPFGADTVNLFTTHAFVLGGQAGGGERPAHLVEEYAITAQSFPVTIGYGALGHLHRPQSVRHPLHYCGSPLQLDFGEAEQAKQVNVVTIEPGTPAGVETVRLTAGLPLRTLTGTLEELSSTDVDDNAWLKVVVQGPGRAGLAQTVRELLGPGVVDVRVESPASEARRRKLDHRSRSPQEVFDEYLKHKNIEDRRVRDLFGELLDEQSDASAGLRV
ncbi:exonuclease SbcCD subunit D [Candidatus Spongiisocius sp.]|uniref:exonuclease SbcCD subunit D n=1 Tax=Candidatus Spongiisocius sp. TaxID=3101273 RepID=UPI003B598A3D